MARCCHTCSSPTTARSSRWCSPAGWLLVTERERWLEGRYLAVDLQLVGERNDTKRGGEIDRALACLAADSLAPDAEGDIWWTSVIDESIKHTVGVSQDLREGVRLSIELIANEVVARRRAKGLDPLPPSRPSRWPSSRCASCTGSCSCSTPRRPRSWRCYPWATGLRARVQPGPAP